MHFCTVGFYSVGVHLVISKFNYSTGIKLNWFASCSFSTASAGIQMIPIKTQKYVNNKEIHYVCSEVFMKCWATATKWNILSLQASYSRRSWLQSNWDDLIYLLRDKNILYLHVFFPPTTHTVHHRRRPAVFACRLLFPVVVHPLKTKICLEEKMQCATSEAQFNIGSVNWQTCLEGRHSVNQHC